ncbi:MAG: hypothetical protein DRG30_06410 [Epsilonproteobacteria bacterium]|nr:MAG: hypothetical protein DRG30_06410 [Campylobacterota bacterium]
MIRKKLSHPPMIIFMEILTVFLFVFMLQRSPSISIITPQERLFLGGQLIYDDDSTGGIKYLSGNRWIDIDKDFGGSFFVDLPCKGAFCQNIPSPNAESIKIAITGRLFESLSQLNFIACNTDASECGNISYTITSSGRVDREALLRDNPVFQTIHGLDRYFL